MSTSQLQKSASSLLSTHLGQYTIRENTRPSWLEGLELDFLLVEIKVAIEVQGAQHYRYIPHFHGNYEGFLESLKRDRRKESLCTENEITLFHVSSEEEILAVIERLPSTYRQSPHPNSVLSGPQRSVKIFGKIASFLAGVRGQPPGIREKGVRTVAKRIRTGMIKARYSLLSAIFIEQVIVELPLEKVLELTAEDFAYLAKERELAGRTA